MSEIVPVGQATHGQLDRFGVNVSYADDHAVLTVCGEIDMMTAPIFGAIVDAVVDQGHGMVVLDASAIEFMDAAGLRVLVTAHNQLLMTGHRLVVRAPTDVLTKLLQISRVAELVWVEPALIERHASRHPNATSTVDGRLASSFVRAHAIPAGLDVVDAALLLVAKLARATIGAADGVSVSLRRHGHISHRCRQRRHDHRDGPSPVRNRGGAVPLGGRGGNAVPHRVPRRRTPLAGVHAPSVGAGDQQHPLEPAARRVRSGRCAEHVLTHPRGVRPARPAVGCAVRTACV